MFRGLLRPGQGFKPFTVYRKTGTTTETGRAVTGKLEKQGELLGILSQADPKEIEQYKQQGHPITHTIVQRPARGQVRATATDVLELEATVAGEKPRRFIVQGKPKDPGELGHFIVYRVEEREDL